MLSIAGSIKGSAFEKLKNVEPNDVGRKQFYEYQTQGKYKLEPFLSSNLDPYFFVLKHGKHQFDLLSRELNLMYNNREWSGFYMLWLDWEGDRWMLEYLCKWYGKIPEWLTKEEEPDLELFNDLS